MQRVPICRVQKDPASIAFAQLAEELRRIGAFEESIETCRAGLAVHPGYLSARVTLGRALIEVNALDEAHAELQTVLNEAGIGARSYYRTPAHLQPAMHEWGAGIELPGIPSRMTRARSSSVGS